jgi:hypothetical protein
MNNETLRILACQIEIPDILTATDRDNHVKNSARKVAEALEKTLVDITKLLLLFQCRNIKPHKLLTVL